MRTRFLTVLTLVLGLMIPALPSRAADAVKTVTSVEVRQRIEQKSPFFLLDVRNQEEYDAGHIEGATLIPLPVLPTRLAEVPKDKKIVVYCRSGRRSGQAAELLQAQGYMDVFSLAGGFNDWSAAKP
jgi:rhodanese-related sulfurtransferase